MVTHNKNECEDKAAKRQQDDEQRKKSADLTVEELERRVALSVPDQKKSPSPVPYMPGTDYGLVKRSNLEQSESDVAESGAAEETGEAEKLTVEELERRVALSVPDQKKSPSPTPYMPGTYYGLVKKENL